MCYLSDILTTCPALWEWKQVSYKISTRKLECFQAEIEKRILRLSSYCSGRVVRVALEWPSLTCRILPRKFLFLLRLLNDRDCISQTLLSSLLQGDYPIQLIESCEFLEASMGVSGLTKKVLAGAVSTSKVREVTENHDLQDLLTSTSAYPNTSLAAKVTAETSWLRL